MANTRRLDVPPRAPLVLRAVIPIPELKDIPPSVIEECQHIERGLDGYERWGLRTAALAMVAVVASRFVHHQATGEWGEGIAHGHYRKVKEWLQGLNSDDIPPVTPPAEAPPDAGTAILAGIAGFALGASLALGAAQSSLLSVYDQKCQDYYWARIGEGRSPVREYLDDVDSKFVVVDDVRPSPSPTWLDSAHRFARHHPEAAAGAMALTVIAAGAAIYFSGGSVLVFAL